MITLAHVPRAGCAVPAASPYTITSSDGSSRSPQGRNRWSSACLRSPLQTSPDRSAEVRPPFCCVLGLPVPGSARDQYRTRICSRTKGAVAERSLPGCAGRGNDRLWRRCAPGPSMPASQPAAVVGDATQRDCMRLVPGRPRSPASQPLDRPADVRAAHPGEHLRGLTCTPTAFSSWSPSCGSGSPSRPAHPWLWPRWPLPDPHRIHIRKHRAEQLRASAAGSPARGPWAARRAGCRSSEAVGPLDAEPVARGVEGAGLAERIAGLDYAADADDRDLVVGERLDGAGRARGHRR